MERSVRWIGGLAIACCLLALGGLASGMELLRLGGRFGGPLLWLGGLASLVLAEGGLLALTLLAVRRSRTWQAALPWGLQLAVIAGAACLPWAHWEQARTLEAHRAGFETVIEALARGELRRGLTAELSLPARYRSLALAEDRVAVNGRGRSLQVLFYAYRSGLDHFGGFQYTADDAPPVALGDDEAYASVRKLRPHWYFVTD